MPWGCQVELERWVWGNRWSHKSQVQQRITKNHYPKRESIPCHLLLRQVCFSLSRRIEPHSTCFQGKFHVHCTIGAMLCSRGSRIWTGSLMRIHSPYLSKHSICTHKRRAHEFYIYLCCPYTLWRDSRHCVANKCKDNNQPTCLMTIHK